MTLLWSERDTDWFMTWHWSVHDMTLTSHVGRQHKGSVVGLLPASFTLAWVTLLLALFHTKSGLPLAYHSLHSKHCPVGKQWCTSPALLWWEVLTWALPVDMGLTLTCIISWFRFSCWHGPPDALVATVQLLALFHADRRGTLRHIELYCVTCGSLPCCRTVIVVNVEYTPMTVYPRFPTF